MIELIVVVAIIGVLAGILIPTMLDYSRSSRVASMNTTASHFNREITIWFTEMNGDGYTIRADATVDFTVTVATPGVYTVTEADMNACFAGRTPPSGYSSDFISYLSENLPDIRVSKIKVVLTNGAVAGILYTVAPTNTVVWNGWEWESTGTRKDGVSSDGVVFGSYPPHHAI